MTDISSEIWQYLKLSPAHVTDHIIQYKEWTMGIYPDRDAYSAILRLNSLAMPNAWSYQFIGKSIEELVVCFQSTVRFPWILLFENETWDSLSYAIAKLDESENWQELYWEILKRTDNPRRLFAWAYGKFRGPQVEHLHRNLKAAKLLR